MARSTLHYFVRRRLAFEPLERRDLLATITVTSLADNSTLDGQVTLREAVRAAELNISVDGSTIGSGADTIQFGPALSGAVSLSMVGDTAEGFSAIAITTDVTIRGNTNGIIIERSGLAAEMRLFRVASGGNLALESITISGGLLRGATGAGPNGAGGEARGGAIFSQGGVNISASTLVANDVRGGDGVGSGAGGSGRGGAIYNDGGNLSIINATFSDDAAVTGHGTGNVSSFGGGVYSRNGSVSIYNSTFTDSTATTGRGVYVLAVNGTATATIHSSIIAQADVSQISRDLIIADDTGGTLIVTGANNLIRTQNNFDSIALLNVDPLLGPLANNGGPTRTHALSATSPAINQGANPLKLSSDQRGGSHTRATAGQPDIGAFEVQTTAGPALTGDYNRNNTVDAADYVLWRKTLGSQVTMFAGADGNGSGSVDPDDHIVWRANFGRVLPEASVSVGATTSSDPPFAIFPHVGKSFARLSGTNLIQIEAPMRAVSSRPSLVMALLDVQAGGAAAEIPAIVRAAMDANGGGSRLIEEVWNAWPDQLELF